MRLPTFGLLILSLTLTARAHALQVGDPEPVFATVDQDGNPWSRAENANGKYLVVYFYPAAMTGGCTKQACSYRDYIKSSPAPDIEIVGISGDTPEGLKLFRQAENLNFTLLSDPDGAVAKAFGVPVRTGNKTIQRTVAGNAVELSRSSTIARWTFILNPQGTVIYKDSAVKAAQDMDKVMAFIRENKNSQ